MAGDGPDETGRAPHPRREAVARAAVDVKDRFSSRGHAMARYVAQRVVLKPTIWSITSVTVIDRDRLKGVEGGFIVVANHSSHLDAPLILGALPRRLARYLATGAAADYFFDVPWRRKLTELFFNAFPVQRGSSTATPAGTPGSPRPEAPGAVAAAAAAAGSAPAGAGSTAGAGTSAASAGPSAARKRAAAKIAARRRAGQPTVSARSLLERGYPVLVFPEGTRSKDGTVASFKPGAAALAAACDVPIIPLALIGAHIAHPRGSSWPRPGRLPVGVAFGDPMRPEPGETPLEFSARLRAEILRLKDANTARILGPEHPSEGARP
ncbi:1-acyl-sn-glycerol-3-phosphate acyltransferase [Frigoribacterium faeni]|uniref:1-acyl-sn-glycerol-3-phosphate acyltransferase n=1 Tax=Frigoribacterium faeni TaxID=145483 RepID=UPI00141AB9FD|nr:1-acyl-sn-glycerol-3-phosphate acyltransferase [Frigoribacterium faeni]